jgi:hypothetical protein
VEQPEPIVISSTASKVDDSKLKRVSLSTNFLLFKDSLFTID